MTIWTQYLPLAEWLQRLLFLVQLEVLEDALEIIIGYYSGDSIAKEEDLYIVFEITTFLRKVVISNTI
jgi:hypothetical protein